jgi:hypothetical protein
MLRNQFANFFTKCYSFVQLIFTHKLIPLRSKDLVSGVTKWRTIISYDNLLDTYKLTNEPMQDVSKISVSLHWFELQRWYRVTFSNPTRPTCNAEAALLQKLKVRFPQCSA